MDSTKLLEVCKAAINMKNKEVEDFMKKSEEEKKQYLEHRQKVLHMLVGLAQMNHQTVDLLLHDLKVSEPERKILTEFCTHGLGGLVWPDYGFISHATNFVGKIVFHPETILPKIRSFLGI